MLPPQSGQTQFRMSDINSELTPIAADLITCIETSTNDQGTISQVSSTPVATKAERKYSMHFAFHNHEGAFGAWFR
jgi:hypothetical protein